MSCRSDGPTNARIMIVGDAPGAEEERLGVPFVGAAGRLLTDLLAKAGIMRSSCFVTNVCRHVPPLNKKKQPDIAEWFSDNKKVPKETPHWVNLNGRWVDPKIVLGYNQLYQEIALVNPTLIIALGGTALWALTGHTNILDWRGSRLSPVHLSCTVVPTIHPASVLRQMQELPVLQMDLFRARHIFEGTQVPRHYDFIVAPTYEQSIRTLVDLLSQADAGYLRLAGDIETRSGHIACYGVAWSETQALCIPFLKAVPADAPAGNKRFYWSVDEEAEITRLIRLLHSHPNIEWDGQNYLYDCQYYHRFLLGIPRRVYDTMIAQHSVYSTMRKGLAFLSSMYARDHVFWKDESKDWDPHLGEKQLWTYNCKDACITWEIGPELRDEVKKRGVEDHAAFQQSLFHPVLRLMNRGIRIDYAKRAKMRTELILAAIDRQEKVDFMVGHPLNCRSPQQVMRFFYDDLKIPGIHHITTDELTVGSAALEQLANREPLLLPLCQAISELRSIGTYISTFIDARPDVDGRMRSAFAVAGTSSNRFKSSINAFGSGLNFQNQPKEEKVKIAAAKATWIKLPNVRELFIPDPGMTFFDMDLDRADLQVVVAEADDKDLKMALRAGVDMHIFNAMAVWNFDVPLDELIEGHPNLPEHKKRYGKQRHLAKQACHATNYGVGDRKLAQTLSITIQEASRFRTRWFAAHPGIKKWHERVAQQASRGYIENRFGARFYILGRFDLPEALAWGPQSTVAGVINRALVNIDAAKEAGTCDIELLLQVHDSLAGQFPTNKKAEAVADLRRFGEVVIPYDDPLIIPVGIGTSEVSWGACA